MMSLRDYYRLKKMGVKNAYEISNIEQTINRIMSGLFVIGALLALLLVYGWMLERDTRELKLAKDEATKNLAHVLSGGTLYDKATGIAFFVTVSEQKL